MISNFERIKEVLIRTLNRRESGLLPISPKPLINSSPTRVGWKRFSASNFQPIESCIIPTSLRGLGPNHKTINILLWWAHNFFHPLSILAIKPSCCLLIPVISMTIYSSYPISCCIISISLVLLKSNLGSTKIKTIKWFLKLGPTSLKSSFDERILILRGLGRITHHN